MLKVQAPKWLLVTRRGGRCVLLSTLTYCHSLGVKSGWNYKELISPQRDSPWSMQQAISSDKKKEGKKEEEKNPHHTWWELWNIAASGMFPRWPVGSDRGHCGFLEGFMGNLMHTYRVSRSNVSCVSLNLELLLFWIQILWFHLTLKGISGSD